MLTSLLAVFLRRRWLGFAAETLAQFLRKLKSIWFTIHQTGVSINFVSIFHISTEDDSPFVMNSAPDTLLRTEQKILFEGKNDDKEERKRNLIN